MRNARSRGGARCGASAHRMRGKRKGSERPRVERHAESVSSFAYAPGEGDPLHSTPPRRRLIAVLGTPYVYRTKKRARRAQAALIRAVPRARLACGQRHSTKAGGGDPSQLSTDAFPFRFTIACDEKYPWNLESSLSIHMRNKLLSIWIFSGSKYPTW